MDEDFKKGKKKANEANPLSYSEFIELTQKEFANPVLEKTKDRFYNVAQGCGLAILIK